MPLQPTDQHRNRRGTARLAVIGAGAWGTTVAALLATAGHHVTLWTRSAAQSEALRQTQVNEKRLPGVPLPPGLQYTADPAEAAERAEAAFVAVQSSHLAAVMERFPPLPLLVSLVKGFRSEEHTSELQSRGHLVCRR